MSAPRDALDLPLDGIRVVEASAGTGKTFTIATLYLRLILERGLQPDAIVVATFTRAAAAELSARLRQRLVIADAILAEDDPVAPRADDDGSHAESRKVIAQALAAGVPCELLRERARAARLAIDTAFIGTLHGFCHRVLAEFGFETGQALRQPELIDDIRALEAEIVRDFWRRGSADAAIANVLAAVWKSPQALARQVCDPRWRGRDVLLPDADTGRLEAELAAIRRRIAAWTGSTLTQADQEIGKCFARPSARRPRCNALRVLQAWARDPSRDDAATVVEAERFDPATMEKLGSFRDHPRGAVFDDVQELRSIGPRLFAERAIAAERPTAELLRDARAYLESQLPLRLAERNLMGHDQAVDRLAATLSGSARGPAAVAKIRTRWQAALIDEFQDTDARQWRVVHALFGASTLVLVGDPKQAIYGFRGGDVHAWLEACAHAQGEPLGLIESHRAGAGLARATNALFSTPEAFIEAGIGHRDIRAARRVTPRALLRDGEPMPALQVWRLDPETLGHADGRLPSRAHATPAIQRACVAWIADVLGDARVQLRDRHGGIERLQPRHIAVLVNDNREAHAMQAALGRAGVPASSNLRASVYESGEAADLALLLDALAAPDDARRARAAHASVLIGDDATAIAASVADEGVLASLLERVAEWAGEVARHGPLAWLQRLIAGAAPRLLALPDGQRRVANYLQLAELLQALHAASFGAGDLAVRFARARVEAVDDADAARLRLDTDADAVTVSTVHAAKGLEYDVVLVPYAVLGRDPAGAGRNLPPLRWYHDGYAARVAVGAGADGGIVASALREIRAEDVRKLYVAVTRASALCVVPWGPVGCAQFSPAFHLLHAAGRDPSDAFPLDVGGCRQALDTLCARANGAAEIIDLPQPVAGRHAAARDAVADMQARAFRRTTLERDWQAWSFSRLVRGGDDHTAADPLPGAGDAGALPDPATQEPGLAGARFGTAVHAAFEHIDFAAWRDVSAVPDSERGTIERGLRAQGLIDSDGAARRAVDLVGRWIGAALNTSLPCGARLCDIAPDQRKAEIEFHLSLEPARSAELYSLLHRHGYQAQRRGVAPARLHGLLTGKIDLTFAQAGRFHIVDWKTNRCAPWDAAALAAEIAAHDYDLQWLIYTLALHRWLRQQRQDYDYDVHVGEVYYLFVRGMPDGRGVHADRPSRALIEAMDVLFAARAEAAA